MSPEYNAFCRQRLHQYNRFTQSQLAISRRLLALRHDQYRELASSHEIVIPHEQAQTGSQLDISRIRADSQLARRLNTSLAAFVRIYRGETTDDPRPNKDLFELALPDDPEFRVCTSLWNKIVREGVQPQWNAATPTTQIERPPNHRSIDHHHEAVRQSIIKGQLDGRYIVVEADLLDQWTNIFVSPIGVAEKPGPPVDIRVINDYSFPKGSAVNDFTDRDNFPEISYNPPRDIARRVWVLRAQFPGHPILIMLGDVTGAFRHIPISASNVHMFAFLFDGYLVIDLACGFGWCGSPAFYAVAGALVNRLYENQRPQPTYSPLDSSPFKGNVWCDDHTCIEPDTGSRCLEANLALRHAMATVLGPHALNEKKFTRWSTRTRALGLLWDTNAGTVSVPPEKITKAQARISAILDSSSSSLSGIHKLLGSLRYVATCFPASKAFYQEIQAFLSTFRGVYTRKRVPGTVRDDLVWFATVLMCEEKFNAIPVEHFARLQPPSRHVMMDASDTGVCVLEPQLQQFIRVQFNDEVRKTFVASKELNSINVRELLGAVLAVVHWGHLWAATGRDRTHVRMWIDNTSAVAWLTKRSSSHPTARMYNRLISISEFRYSLTCSAQHIAGKHNTMADAGSRTWSSDHPLYGTWTNLRYMGLDLSASPEFTILLQGIKRLSPSVHKLQPITPAFLRLLRLQLDFNKPQERLLWGTILIGFFFLLRRSEYLLLGSSRHSYCLKRKNVFFSDSHGRQTSVALADSVTIGLEGAKNDQYGRGAWRTMHASGDPIICPVVALQHVLEARVATGSNTEFLCGEVSAADVSKALKSVARTVGVPQANYSTHSIRIGGATALLSGGASHLAIKLLGRWISSCFEEYRIQAAESTRSLAQRMVSPSPGNQDAR
ncbi:hypothetical protein PHMEG_00021235 [Phytophthora megakarya]|uniref:Uncharacterized protein n=1 Tax=Phytophthora megakarya TaxID=4795 RepID=A0A225VMC9_9STRA|nr:hypothetical protein PHMEG_00021235 [Phytophthora megakarya]